MGNHNQFKVCTAMIMELCPTLKVQQKDLQYLACVWDEMDISTHFSLIHSSFVPLLLMSKSISSVNKQVISNLWVSSCTMDKKTQTLC